MKLAWNMKFYVSYISVFKKNKKEPLKKVREDTAEFFVTYLS